jgi:hypothetical protein
MPAPFGIGVPAHLGSVHFGSGITERSSALQ